MRGGLDRLVDLVERGFDAPQHVAYLLAEVIGALGQVAYLVGDHREPPARLASASGLDRGIQGQQVGLRGDDVDIAEQPAHGIHLLMDVLEVARDPVAG